MGLKFDNDLYIGEEDSSGGGGGGGGSTAVGPYAIVRMSDDWGTISIDNVDNALDSAFKGNGVICRVYCDGMDMFGNYVAKEAFAECPSLERVDCQNLVSYGGFHAFEGMFKNCTALETVDLSQIYDIDPIDPTYGLNNDGMFYETFAGCTSLENVDLNMFNSVRVTEGMCGMFKGCTSLQSISFPNAFRISGHRAMADIFSGCTNLTNISWGYLEYIGGEAGGISGSWDNAQFAGAFNNIGTTTITFQDVTRIHCIGLGLPENGTFYNNNTVTVFNFPSLEVIEAEGDEVEEYLHACEYLFAGCTNLQEIHFAASNQSTIEASQGYATKWGAPSNTVIYFDL